MEANVVELFPKKSQNKAVPKYAASFVIRCKFEGSKNWLEGTVSLISLEGIQIKISSNFQILSQQKLLLQLFVPSENQGEGINLLISGMVSDFPKENRVLDNSEKNSELWVQFDEMDQEGEEHFLLVEFIAHLLSSGKAVSASKTTGKVRTIELSEAESDEELSWG